MSDEIAPPGQVFVCGACGKRSRTRYGLNGTAIDHGWDASCMMNSCLCWTRRSPVKRVFLAVPVLVDGKMMGVKEPPPQQLRPGRAKRAEHAGTTRLLWEHRYRTHVPTSTINRLRRMWKDWGRATDGVSWKEWRECFL